MRVLLKPHLKQCLFALGLMVAACSPAQAPNSSGAVPEISATTGVFTDAEEAFYDARLKAMIAAFQSGKSTTAYDTEITFGDNLKARPLKRGEAKVISPDVISDIIDYAKLHKSDSVVIFENGQVVSERYFGDISESSLINAKSLAKPLGVIAMGRAIEKGFVKSPDQPVSDFIIEWKETDKSTMLIRHVLDMRTGLLAQEYTPETQDILNRAYLHPRHDEVIIHEYPLKHQPGSRYDYSNANSELVGMIIERATGMTYQDWLTTEVLAPLNTGGGKIWLNRENGMAHSGCCMALTSETYLKLGVVILQNGEWEGKPFLSKSFVSEVLTPTPQNKYVGMGVYLGRHFKANRGAGNPDEASYAAVFHSEPYIDKDIALFDGNGNQVVYMMPSHDIIVMRLGGRTLKDPKWDNAYIPNLVSNSIISNED